MHAKKRRKPNKTPRIFGGVCRLCGHFSAGVAKWEMRKASPTRCPKCGGMLDSKSFKAGHTLRTVKERPRGNRIVLGPPLVPAQETLQELK